VFKHLTSDAGMSLLSLVFIIFMFTSFTAATMLAMRPADNGRQTQETLTKADIIEKALKKYKATNATTPPATLNQLVTTTGTPCILNETTSSPYYQTVQGWCGPYIERPITSTAGAANDFLTDGWGTVFQYTGTLLKSCGPDKTCGTSDDITFTNF
jgi:type II secretory pathway pseudopilin PulG